MGLTDINIREKEFHNKLQSKKVGRFENIFYKSLYNINEDFFSYIEKKANQSKILDFGSLKILYDQNLLTNYITLKKIYLVYTIYIDI